MRLRSTIILAAFFALVCSSPLIAASSAQVTLQVTPHRSTKLVTWVPQKVKGVVLFSTGHGSWPEKYDAIATAWQAAGFAVIAPIHVDSLHYPDREKFTREASFGERIADLSAASAYAARTWPGKPVVAAGHSFGTLTALCLGGGLSKMGNFRDPRVRAVLGFSSPGHIPGLIGPDAYTMDALPIMVITGDMDTVPGLVTDWHDHLFPVQSSPAGDKFAVIYPGAQHELIGHPDGPSYNSAVATSIRFLKAYGLGDASAKSALAASNTTERMTWIKR